MKLTVNSKSNSGMKYKGKGHATLNVLAFLGGILGHALEDLINNSSLEIDDVKEDKDTGEITFVAKTGSGLEILVKSIPVPQKKDLYDMYIKSKDGKHKAEYPHIKADKFDDKIVEFLEKFYDGEGLEDGFEDAKKENRTKDESADFDVDSSNHIRVSLQKIQSSSDSAIKITRIETAVNPILACEYIEDIIQDDEFYDQVSEDPTTYDIFIENDAFDIQPCGCEPNIDGTYHTILIHAYHTLFKLQAIHWNTKCKQFMRLHTMTNDYVYKQFYDIDKLAEIALQNQDWINMNDIIQSTDKDYPVDNLDYDTALSSIEQTIKDYVAVLELYYPNVPHQVQSIFDEWIDYWKTEYDYKLQRMI